MKHFNYFVLLISDLLKVIIFDQNHSIEYDIWFAQFLPHCHNVWVYQISYRQYLINYFFLKISSPKMSFGDF